MAIDIENMAKEYEPIEDLTDDEEMPYQFAIKRNGKLHPLTKSQLFIEIIESE